MTHLDNILRIQGNNLFDGVSNIVLGKYIAAATGEIGASASNYYCEDYFEVKPNASYVFFGERKSDKYLSRYNRIHFYDATKTFISSSTYNVGQKSVVLSPANAKYARVSCNVLDTGTLDQAMVALFNWYFGEGNTATPYSPYYGEPKSIGSTTKAALTRFLNTRKCVNLWNLGDYIGGATGQRTFDGLDPNKTYSIIVKASPDFSTESVGWSVSPRNADDSSRGNLFYMSDYIAGQSVSAQFTGAYKLRMQMNTFTGSVYVCLVEGVSSVYYPHFSPTTVLPSLKAFGKAVTKRKADKLWGRYVPCEYIAFDGLPYIDLAPLTTASDIEITFRRRDGYTQTNFLFGTNPNSNTSPVVGAWYGSQGLVVQNGSVRNNSSLDTNWHVLKVTSTKTYLDGAELASAGERTTLQNLIIGSARYEQTGAVDSRCFHGDISRVKVGNNIFVAGKDVTGNTFGLIDPAENKFYGNAGTGSITAGSLIQPIASISGVTPSTDEITVRVGTSGYLLNTATWTLVSASGTLGADVPYTELCPDILETNVGDALYGGKNLVDFNETRVTNSTWASADKTKGFEIVADVYSKVVGNDLGTNGNCFGAFIPCRKGESISLNFFDYEPYYGRCFYCEVDANLKVLTTPVQYSNGTSITQKTFTATNDNCIGFAIEWYLNSSQERNYTKENYMIVRGTTVPTVYEPYYPGLHPSGEQKVLMGEQGVVDLGTLSWTRAASGDNYIFYASVSDRKVDTNNLTFYCGSTEYTGRNSARNLLENMEYGRFDNQTSGWGSVTVAFRNDAFTTAAEFKSAMSGKYLFYQRSTDASFISPQTRTLSTFLLSENSYLDTQLDTNNVENDWAFKVLDGTENWGYGGNSSGYGFYLAISDCKTTGKVATDIFCTHLPTRTDGGSYSQNSSIGYFTATSNIITVRDDQFINADKADLWKAFLASEYAKGTPVIICYPLATPAKSTVAIEKVVLDNCAEKQAVTTSAYGGSLKTSATYLGEG